MARAASGPGPPGHPAELCSLACAHGCCSSPNHHVPAQPPGCRPAVRFSPKHQISAQVSGLCPGLRSLLWPQISALASGLCSGIRFQPWHLLLAQLNASSFKSSFNLPPPQSDPRAGLHVSVKFQPVPLHGLSRGTACLAAQSGLNTSGRFLKNAEARRGGGFRCENRNDSEAITPSARTNAVDLL